MCCGKIEFNPEFPEDLAEFGCTPEQFQQTISAVREELRRARKRTMTFMLTGFLIITLLAVVGLVGSLLSLLFNVK
jgi:predicted nucleic acid-binding Zn ribbon protein